MRIRSARVFAVSEALTNADEHGRAEQVLVRVARHNGSLRIAIRGDGVGGSDTGARYGLRGLAERVAALDCLLACRAPGAATMLTAEIPCAS